ncbi:hypothetical protein CcaverHIS631_0300020 [Cutaneotrichosporon cavernicola]|nr:hypothetical protein CcaverHIS631_0300020 [Cutaneotrichosporon cavernicola]
MHSPLDDPDVDAVENGVQGQPCAGGFQPETRKINLGMCASNGTQVGDTFHQCRVLQHEGHGGRRKVRFLYLRGRP